MLIRLVNAADLIPVDSWVLEGAGLGQMINRSTMASMIISATDMTVDEATTYTLVAALP